MLTDRERQTLREIERGLSVDAPALAHLMRTRRVRRSVNWVRLTYDAVAAVAVLSAVGCVLLGVVGSAAVAALFAAVVLGARHLRFAPKAGGSRRPGRRPGPGWRQGRGRPGGQR
ncbi:MAG TPA: DUF3040 domain-containing protein [Pseudonocardia sp.]|nr:DUF3040 domain-containing protein [Pseudonocardia sp.]